MKRKVFYQVLVFGSILMAHLTYSMWRGMQLSRRWAQLEQVNWFTMYFKQSDYMMGIAYAMTAAFTVFALMIFLEFRKASLTGMLGGITLTGFLSVGGCFLMGCCGSPMLVIYLSLFGASFLKFTKPLMLVVTSISVAIGYFWLNKKLKNSSCGCSKGDHP